MHVKNKIDILISLINGHKLKNMYCLYYRNKELTNQVVTFSTHPHKYRHLYKKLSIDDMPYINTCTCNLVFRQVKKWNEYFTLLVNKNSCVSWSWKFFSVIYCVNLRNLNFPGERSGPPIPTHPRSTHATSWIK